MKRRACTLLLALCMLVGMLAVGFVLPASADEVEIFSADFTTFNKNGGGTKFINDNTSNVQNYLLSKFAFYRNQEGTYFERPHVNGYVADVNGNSITASGGTVGVATYAPDTGLKMDGVQYIDYTGNKAGPLSQWALEWNQLFCNDRTDVDVYRNSNWMYVKNQNGDLASLKNFRAEIEFYAHNRTKTASTVAVVFRSKTAGNVLGADGAEGDRQLFSLDVAGGIYFGNSFVRNSSSHSESVGGMLADKIHILTLEVVGDTATIVLKIKDGAEVYRTTKTLTELDSGYLGIGGSLAGVAYKTIKVTRLDKDGEAIDFEDTTDGYDFYANFHGIGTYRDEWHWLMGSENKGYYRDNGGADFAWLEKVNNDVYWPLNSMDKTKAEDAAILSYLNSKFNVNFEGQGWQRSYDNPVETEFVGYSQSGSARFLLSQGECLLSAYSLQGTDGQNNIQKALSLQPKKADGSLWKVKNFETSFAVGFNTSQATSAAAFYFRATHKGGVAADATANVLVLNHKGYQFFEGSGPAPDYNYEAYTPWDENAQYNSVRVYVKAVDDKLTIKVTSDDGKTVLANVEKTIAESDAGYLHYTLINGNNQIKDIAFNEVTVPVQADNTAVVDGNTVTVKAGEGYQLKAGSLVVTDAQGNEFVPTRVGYRTENGDATQYTIPESAVAPFEVDCEFIQPGDEVGYNVGFLGTSTNAEKNGLRFVNRFNVDKDGNMLYNGEKVVVKEYGMLIASAAILPNADDLDIETANDSMHVHQIKWGCEGGSTKYFDKCDDYGDVSVQIVNIPDGAAKNLDFHTRAYIILADDTVVYMETHTENYNNG